MVPRPYVNFFTKRSAGIGYCVGMKITLYHEVDQSSKDNVLSEGIDREANGQKTDSEKKRIDNFLDTHLPAEMELVGISRQEVVYAYMAYQDTVIDIRDGEFIPIDEFNDRSDQVLLRLSVDSKDCYVSDLDLYDTLARAMELKEQNGKLEYLASQYWDRVVPYDKYEIGEYNRPEIMIAQDIRPEAIEVVE